MFKRRLQEIINFMHTAQTITPPKDCSYVCHLNSASGAVNTSTVSADRVANGMRKIDE